jgi:hypothetical protein
VSTAGKTWKRTLASRLVNTKDPDRPQLEPLPITERQLRHKERSRQGRAMRRKP